MIIKNMGIYRLLEDFNFRTPISGGILGKGSLLHISQVDKIGRKVIGPELKDWTGWDLPVEEVIR